MSAQQNNPPSLQAPKGRYRQSHCRCAEKRATRTETRSCAIPQQRCRWRSKTSLALAFQRTIQDAKIADGTYVGNPATVGEIKKDLAAIGVTVPDVPKKIVAGTAVKNLARTTPRAIPKERTPAVKKPSAVKGKPAVSKYAEIGSVKKCRRATRAKIAGICVEKKDCECGRRDCGS